MTKEWEEYIHTLEKAINEKNQLIVDKENFIKRHASLVKSLEQFKKNVSNEPELNYQKDIEFLQTELDGILVTIEKIKVRIKNYEADINGMMIKIKEKY